MYKFNLTAGLFNRGIILINTAPPIEEIVKKQYSLKIQTLKIRV